MPPDGVDSLRSRDCIPDAQTKSNLQEIHPQSEIYHEGTTYYSMVASNIPFVSYIYHYGSATARFDTVPIRVRTGFSSIPILCNAVSHQQIAYISLSSIPALFVLWRGRIFGTN